MQHRLAVQRSLQNKRLVASDKALPSSIHFNLMTRSSSDSFLTAPRHNQNLSFVWQLSVSSANTT